MTDKDLSTANVVNLSIPAEPEYFGLARLTASGVVASLGYDVESVDECRLAVDELCIACTQGANPSSILTIGFSWDEAFLEVQCSVTGVDDDREPGHDEKDADGRDLSHVILAALAYSHEIAPVVEGVRRASMRLARTRARGVPVE